jgi:hypothetical protein
MACGMMGGGGGKNSQEAVFMSNLKSRMMYKHRSWIWIAIMNRLFLEAFTSVMECAA